MIAVNNKARLLFALLLAFAIAKIAIATQFNPAGWDEAVYTGMGKHIYSLGASGMWESIRPLGLPLILGAVWKSGLPFAFTAEIIMTGFAAGSAILTYLMAKKAFNETTGLFAAMLVIGSPLFFRQSSLFLTEIPSTFFALASLYLMAREKHAAAGALAAAAAMFKFPHLLLAGVLSVPLIAGYMKSRDAGKLLESAAKTAAPFAVIMLVFLLANYLAYRESPADLGAAIKPLILASSHSSNALHAAEGTLQNLLFYGITLIKQNIFFLFALPGIFIAAKELKRSQKNHSYALLAYLAAYLAYFTISVNKQERFALLMIPAAAIFAAYGTYRALLTGKGTTKTGTLVTAALFIMAGFASYGIISADAAYAKERLHAEKSDDYGSLSGQVLSSEPWVSYHTDLKVIPYYFSTADGEAGIREAARRFYENRGKSTIIFRDTDFYCAEKDGYCREQLSRITKESKP